LLYEKEAMVRKELNEKSHHRWHKKKSSLYTKAKGRRRTGKKNKAPGKTPAIV